MNCGGYAGANCNGGDPIPERTSGGCGGGRVCGGPVENIEEVNRRREREDYVPNDSKPVEPTTIWSDEVEAELGGGTGYKIVKEVPTCHGKYYESYDVDERLAEFIIDLISRRRENDHPYEKGRPGR